MGKPQSGWRSHATRPPTRSDSRSRIANPSRMYRPRSVDPLHRGPSLNPTTGPRDAKGDTPRSGNSSHSPLQFPHRLRHPTNPAVADRPVLPNQARPAVNPSERSATVFASLLTTRPMHSYKSCEACCASRFRTETWRRSWHARSTHYCSRSAGRKLVRVPLPAQPGRRRQSSKLCRATQQRSLPGTSRPRSAARYGKETEVAAHSYRGRAGSAVLRSSWSSIISCPGPAAESTPHRTSPCAVAPTINTRPNWLSESSMWLNFVRDQREVRLQGMEGTASAES